MRYRVLILVVFLCFCLRPASAAVYSVRAVEASSGRPLKKIWITVRYDCNSSGTTFDQKMRCQFVQRQTDRDGFARFPDADAVHDIDEIFVSSARYETVSNDMARPFLPGSATGTIALRHKSLVEVWEDFFGIE